MARYFQAPVMQPVDYGYSMPFQEKMAYLQQQQALQDKGRADVESLYDVGQLNALKQDYAERDKLLNQRYEEVDALMTDENGNLRDFRNIRPAVTAIARRRAKEEQSGGKWNAIQSNYEAAAAYQKEIGEMHAKGKIGIKRQDALIADAFANYKGIGERDQFGAYNRFSGRTAAEEVDDIQIAYDYAKDVAFQKIQASGIIDQNGMLADNETINNIMNSPEFKSVMGGMYVQTGSVEFRTMETIKNVTQNALYSNNQLKEDILQEAWQNGLGDPEMQEQYYHMKINELSINAADKYASVKFSPQVKKNWLYEKQVDLANGKALIDYQETKKARHFEFTTETSQFKITDPEGLNKKIETGNKSLESLNQKIENMQNRVNAGDASQEEIDDLKNFQNDRDVLQQELATYHRQKETIVNSMIKKHGKDYIKKKATDKLMDIFTNERRSDHDQKDLAILEMEVGNIIDDVKVELGLTDAQLFTMMENGSFMSTTVPGTNSTVGQRLREASKDAGIEAEMGFYWTEEHTKGMSAMFNGEGYSLSEAFADDIHKSAKAGEFIMQENATATMGEGDIKYYNEALTDAVDSAGDMINTGTGEPFSPREFAAKYGKYSGHKAYDLKELDPQTGNPLFLVEMEYIDKRTKSKMTKSVKVAVPKSGATANSIAQNKRKKGRTLIKSGQAQEGKPEAYDDFAQGSYDVGTAELMGSNIHELKYLEPGSTQIVRTASSDAPYFVKRTHSGAYKIGPGTPDGRGGWIEPNFLDNEGIYADPRIWTQSAGQPAKYQYANHHALIEAIGYVAHMRETNPLYNPANRNKERYHK